MAGTVADFLRKNGLLNKITTTPQNFNYMDHVVQSDDDPTNVASGEATILYSAPPVMNSANLAEHIIPIGTVQGFQESQTPNIQPFNEMGSRLKRFAIGMANYQASFSKVLTLHSNLMHALYAWIATYGSDATMSLLGQPAESSGTPQSHFVTLESEITRLPFGLILVTVTAGGKLVSREFYEKCYIANIGKAVQAGSAMIQENVSITAVRKLPCSVPAVDGVLNRKDFTIRLGNGDIRPNDTVPAQ